MGHLSHLKEEYRALVKRLDAGQVGLPEPEDPEAREAWKQILEIMYTPEEAELASRIPVRPSSLAAVAKQVGVPPAELKPRLDHMCDKGLVMDLVHPETGAIKYLLSPPVVGFFEFSFMRAHDMFPKKPLAEAMDAYMYKDPAFTKELFSFATVIGRALVHEERIDDEVQAEVLDWQRATALIENARSVAVSICYCRHKAQHLGRVCDAPKEICLTLNAGADFVVRRKFGRRIDKGEAMDLLHAARKAGLVQIADNALDRPIYICNCCGCCCEQLRAINHYDLPAVNPSGFEPLVNEEICKGCSRCSRACPIAAISMRPVRTGAKRKNELRPEVDRERCIGCGVCASTCRNKATAMVRAQKQPHVPATSVERSLRMALERGRLAHLLFDEWANRGTRFLNRALKALTSLPPAQRMLASEQVQSRFIRMALAAVTDPFEARPS